MGLTTMVSEFALGVGLSILGVLISALLGTLAFLFKKIWDMKEGLDSITQSYSGSEYDQGHLQETRKEFERINSNLDDLQDLVCSVERRRVEEHEEVKEHLVDIINVMRDEGINGGLPEVTDD